MGLEQIASTIYDRILRPSTRFMSRKLFVRSPDIIAYFQAPAYTLARTRASFHFTVGVDNPALDITERHMLLQFGYSVSSCGKWVIGTCCDHYGEACESKVWAVGSGGQESPVEEHSGESNPTEQLVDDLMGFIKSFSQKASLEWRWIISKLGVMSELELQSKLTTFYNMAQIKS